MSLRKLKSQDAPLMLEWMHDKSIVENMQNDFMTMKLNDCLRFINNSIGDKENIHMAIVDNNDEYLGTVSLKHIRNGCAEFAIAIRSVAMGKGISKNAMKEIINYGFFEYGLKCIYWCVSPDNIRAIKFYDKNGYSRFSWEKIQHIINNDSVIVNKSYYWYIISIDDWKKC